MTHVGSQGVEPVPKLSFQVLDDLGCSMWWRAVLCPENPVKVAISCVLLVEVLQCRDAIVPHSPVVVVGGHMAIHQAVVHHMSPGQKAGKKENFRRSLLGCVPENKTINNACQMLVKCLSNAC